MKQAILSLLLIFVVVVSAQFSPSSSVKTSLNRFNGQTALEIKATWSSAKTKAAHLVSQLTLQEKVNLTTGVHWLSGPCIGDIPAIPRVHFPGYCLHDSPTGVRFGDYTSAFPGAISVAATWDKNLYFQNGQAMGAEHRGKGVNIPLAPMANLFRSPTAGRNWEGWGGEPFLTGVGAAQTVLGLQSNGVIATAKHFVGNEQEHFRTTSSSNIDDRTLHEVYAYPFLQMVLAGVSAVMCSYNQVNGIYACENNRTLNGILKGEFQYQSFVMSDWYATMSGVPSVLAGLDMTMPGGLAQGDDTSSYLGVNLTLAVQSGEVPVSRLNDMATRILTAWYQQGQDTNYPPTNFNWINPLEGSHTHVAGNHYQLIRKIGADSIVLLKNTNNFLPLSKNSIPNNFPISLGIIGSDAFGPTEGPNPCQDHGCDTATLAQGWGSGTTTYPYLISPFDAIQETVNRLGWTLAYSSNDYDYEEAYVLASYTNVALVFVNSDSGEGYITVEGNEGDRNNMSLWHSGDDLVELVSSLSQNVIVVVHSVGPIIADWWDIPSIKAIVWAGVPGQESGNSLVDVLFGAVNPSGKLVYTIAKEQSDYPAQVVYEANGPITQINYTEGLFLDYRWFDAHSITPQYEFGFGLSYTTFRYYSLTIQKYPGLRSGTIDILSDYTALEVSFHVQNSGRVDGAEAAQVYISYPSGLGEPVKVLRGFDKFFIEAGSSVPYTIYLSEIDLSIWNTASQVWTIPSGHFTVQVGASSRDIRLTGSFTI